MKLTYTSVERETGMTKRLGVLAGVLCACAAAMIAATSAFAAFPGANGKIAFEESTGATGATFHIFAIDPNGANRVQLTSGTGDDYAPSYSADGEKIAFVRYPPASSFGQIWVMGHNGAAQAQLTPGAATAEDYAPAFSPDGTKIVFDRYDSTTARSQVWIMNSDGTGQAQLTFPGPNGDQGSGATISPNGERIAFAHTDGATKIHSIATMNLNGTGLAQVTPNAAPSDDFEPDWSPDGSKIAFTRGFDDLLTVDANGTGSTKVVSATTTFVNSSPAYSPQGTQLAYYRTLKASPSTASVFLANSVGLDSGLTPLVTPTPPGDAYEPAWQPLNPPACTLGPDVQQQSYGSVTVTATCTNENAQLTAQGTGKAKKVGRTVAAKAKSFTIPPVTSGIVPNIPTTVTLTIPKAAKKALKKAAKAGKKGKATITANIADDLGQTATDTVAVTFQPK